MSKKSSADSAAPLEALEIIELATNDLSTLAKAFDLIAEVCEHRDAPEPKLADEVIEGPLH